MENSQAILDKLSNIRYYTDQIRKLTSEQFDLDFHKSMTEEELEKRMRALRRAWSSASDIDAHCEVIRLNMEQVKNE